jgi:prepilin-type N-terminal cleavage/methylation domain-containing protein
MPLRQEERGWTLIELVLVILLLVILAAATTVSVQSYGTIKLNNAARKLASDIGFAQQMSISKQNRHGVIFTTTAPYSYTVFENDNTVDPARNPVGGGDFTVDYSTGEFQGITISTALPGAIVKFDSLGAPLRNNGAALSAPNNTVILSLSGATPVTLIIEPNTGRVSY